MRGIKLGLWSELAVSQGFALGKRRRNKGETQAPVKPDTSWKSEELSNEDPYNM